MERELFIQEYKKASPSVNVTDLENVLRSSIECSQKSEPHNPRGHRNLIIAMEELSELQKEISKELRGKGDSTAILEELADVSIVIYYIKEICGITDDALNKAINVKKDRLVSMIEKTGDYK